MAEAHITEDDLLHLFSTSKKKRKIADLLWAVLQKTLVFLMLLLLVYGAMNFSALKSKFLYWYKSDLLAEPVVDESAKVINSDVSEEVKKQNEPEMADNTLKISALGIDVPIIWRVNNQPKEVSNALENGVIQINGTALPGQKGNIYITGHSSNYSWARGSYKNIFALLEKLVVGDIVYLKYNGQVYSYKVKEERVVLPTDLSVLQPTEDSRLTLVTCWPVGTSLKRWVSIAEQIYPDPAKNAKSGPETEFKKLPSGR